MLELNRNPENYFAEVEQAAFKPSALVRGIAPSPDKMLQARLMSYADAEMHRLFDEGQCERLVKCIADRLGQARREVQLLMVSHFFKADEDYGRRVAKALGIGSAEFR